MDGLEAGFPAIRWGFTFGIVLVAVKLVPLLWMVLNGYHVPPDDTEIQQIASQLGGVLFYYALGNTVISLASYFLAGFFTTRDTGTVGSGAFAAVVAYLAYMTVSYLVTGVILRGSESMFLDEMASLPDTVRAILALTYTFSNVCGLLIGALVTWGIGALGALLGRAIYGPATY